MNIVVFGKNGQLAQSLRNQANLDANYVSSAEVDFMKPSRVSEFLNDISPELIINCSAYTNVVAAENDEESAHKINVESVGKISEFCNLNNTHFIHISTELVFDGEGLNEKIFCKKTGKLIISISPRYYRELETNGLAGDPTETIQKTGWSPNYTFEMLLEEMIKYELEKN